MVRKLLLVTAALAVPAVASAQGIGVAARAGTLGVGGEAAISFGNLAIRGGFGVLPVEFKGEYSDIEYQTKPSSPLMNIGVDYYLGNTLRIGGGLLMLSEPTTMEAELDGTVRIGTQDYPTSQVGTLSGELDHGGAAPYAIVGFGRHTSTGIGVFMDLGAAFLKEAKLTLSNDGPAAGNAQFQQQLEIERQAAEKKAKDYLKILPIVSIGLRFGIGI